MTVGDTISKRIKIYDPSLGSAMQAVTVTATVVYVHPERRFYTVECKLPGGTIRETEYFYPRCGMKKMKETL